MATQVSYQFTHEALTAADHVQVVRFEGREGISQLFEFTIELLCSNADLDQDDMLDKDATFSFAMGDDKRVVQGILSEFDAIKQVNNQVLYQAVLVPRLWQLSLYKTNEVYLDMTTPEMIKAVLAEGGLSDIDYDFSRVDEGNTKKYRKWPFKLQYAESHLDFMSRMMERDGIYYFFEATENGEKIIFCDDLNHHSGIENSTIKYLPASSLEINQAANTVSNFIAQRQRLPNKVLLRDYNDNTPSLDIKGEYEVDPRGKGEVYVWGLNIENSDEGLHLAKVSAERLIAKHHTYSGESTVCRLVPGFLATLEGHFRAKCNIEYQVVSIEHQGINPEIVQEATKQQAYENQFIAISSDTQFRAELLTARPEIHGNLNAFVDASGDGHYAEVDKEGRYRITLPFDRVDREGKKASHYIRMSQPFSGENQGMHFPLRKGAEVLLSFIGGDPDRPVISGSIPNASQPSVVNEENQTNSLIKTGAGNKIELEDKDGKNRIKFETGDSESYMHLGAPNHAGDGVVTLTKGMERKEVMGGQQITVVVKSDDEENRTSNYDQLAHTETGKEDVADTKDLIIEQGLFQFAIKDETGCGKHDDGFEDLSELDKIQLLTEGKTNRVKEAGTMTRETELSGKYLIERRVGDKYTWTDGQEYYYGGGNVFEFGNGYTEVHADEDGCDGEEYWPDKENRLGVPNLFGATTNDSDIEKLQTEIESLESNQKIADYEESLDLHEKFIFTIEDFHSRIKAQEANESNQDDEIKKENLEVYKNDIYPEFINRKQSIEKESDLSDSRKGWISELNLEPTTDDGFSESYDKNFTNLKKASVPEKPSEYSQLETLRTKYERAVKKNTQKIAENALVEKTWADTFTYQSGNNYEWGDTCDYAFGGGYAENLPEDTEINSKSWPHDIVKDGPDVKSIKGKKVSLNMDVADIEKTVLDAYGYTKGNTIEVVVGDTEAHVHGDTYEYITGYSFCEVDGDTKEKVTGNTKSIYHGGVNEMFMGGTVSSNLAASHETTVGAASSIMVGLFSDIMIAGGLEVFLGWKHEINPQGDMEAKETKMETVKAAIVAQKMEAKIANMCAKNAKTDLKKVQFLLSKAQTKIENQNSVVLASQMSVEKVNIKTIV